MVTHDLEDRLESAIRHINTSIDIDQWAQSLAVESMRIRIAMLKTGQPDIIHCRECKHMVEHKHYGNLGESAYTCEGNMDGWILPDSFCSHAERRTDEHID